MSSIYEKERESQDEFRVETLGGDRIFQWLKFKASAAKIKDLPISGFNGDREDSIILAEEVINDNVINNIGSYVLYNDEELVFDITTIFVLNREDSPKPTERKRRLSSLGGTANPFEAIARLGDLVGSDGEKLNLMAITDILRYKSIGQELEFELESENTLVIKDLSSAEIMFHRKRPPNPFDPIVAYCFHLKDSLNGKEAEGFELLYQKYGAFLQKVISAAYESKSKPVLKKMLTLEPPKNLEEKLNDAKSRLETSKKVLRAGGILDEDFTEMIQERVRLRERPKETFDDIGGSEQVKEELKSILIGLKKPELFRKWGTEPARGVLLHGEPGTGKTLLAKALAHEADVDLYVVSVADIVNSLYGRSEKLIQAVFEDAMKNRPCIVFFDEIDALASHREHSTEVTSRIVTTFLTNLDGLKDRGEGMVVIGTTNRQNAIDPAMLRPGRFDTIVEVPLPNEDSRREIFRIHLNYARKTAQTEVFDDLDINELVKATKGMSGADIKELIRRALAEKVKQEIAGNIPTLVSTNNIVNVILGYERISSAKKKLGFI